MLLYLWQIKTYFLTLTQLERDFSDSHYLREMAYAVVTSLLTTLDQVLQFNPSLISQSRGSVDSLYGTLTFLQAFLEDIGNQINDQEALKFLEEKIRDAGYKAEDKIDLCLRRIHVADNEHDQNNARREIYDELQQITKVMDSIQGEVMKFKNDHQHIKDLPITTTSLPLRSSGHVLDEENTLVGMEDDFNIIRDQLFGQIPELNVVSIVGMGGIGKSTLARRTFKHPSVLCRFDVSSWVTVSQEYDAKEMLLDVLSFGTPGAKVMYRSMSEDELLDQVHKKLKYKRYLIVLDDMWSIEAWDQVRRSFPDDENGSRIMITTRLLEVANCVGNDFPPHHMSFLNLEDSWKLLSLKVFVKEDCPPQLEEIGRQIAQKCQGLPLSIVVVAGLLSKINRTHDDWKEIAENVNSCVGSTSEQCLAILALSYNYLPYSLKACFLYMGVFLEDAEIDANRLISVWVAEGFLKRISLKKPEEVAEECLEDLVSRSLIMVSSRGRVSGKIRNCRIHDLVRLLCLREGKTEKFFQVVSKCYQVSSEGVEIEHRLFLHEDAVRNQNLGLEKCNLDSIRTILCIRQPHTFLLDSECYKIVDSRFQLLRVLDVLMIHFRHFPTEITQLVHLRYLAFTTGTSIPASISNLWNLQTMIVIPVAHQLSWPLEIWKMSSLRHFFSGGISMPLPAPPEAKKFSGLENLEELFLNTASSNWKAILMAVPNVKELDVVINLDPIGWHNVIDSLIHLVDLQKLGIHLAIPSNAQFFRRPAALLSHVFPKNLKSLTLAATHLLWKDMTMLGNLPNLEVLKLEHFAFQGIDWNLDEGGFTKLKLLEIFKTNLVNWKATSDSLPCLECLILRHCYKLEEIPTEIGDIPTLKLIELHHCSQAAVTCAEEILQEQQSFGNEILAVRSYNTGVQYGVMKGEGDEAVAMASAYGPDVTYNYNHMG
ncbi:putative late blight resistance protein homolog R1A-3 [Lycium ferocissimum]|uniref:putative late blight resistance protein homolog R1A-3 n=1 Tax=Lycium ferocissimum TaxID=112874 RepID=UPI00281634FF|nr:putative late blight resistance protein homolog R1A-3 [Lycium ferocissimum]